MRDISYKIAPHFLGPTDVGQIVEHDYNRIDIARAIWHRCNIRLNDTTRPYRYFKHPRLSGRQDFTDCGLQIGIAKDFERRFPGHDTVRTKQGTNGSIRQSNSSGLIQYHHALSHGFENRFQTLLSFG